MILRLFALTASFMLLIAGGCVENRASFFIQQVQPVEEDCSVDNDESKYAGTYGFLDVLFQGTYFFSPLLRNQLTPRSDPDSLVAESNGIQVNGANIRIWAGGRPQGETIYEYYQPASAYVHPGGTTPMVFAAIPGLATEAIIQFEFGSTNPDRTELVGYEDIVTIGVQMLGITNGGDELETPWFYFPIYICFGCTVFCPPDSGDATADPPVPFCASTEEPDMDFCPGLMGQTGGIDCRYCATMWDDGAQFCRQAFCGIP